MWVAPGVGADSRANELCREEGAQARIMWFDAEANLWQLSTREGVADTVRRCKDAGINTIIVDVKPLSGLVLYQSKIAPRLTESGGKPYPPDYDLLATVIDDGHKAGIPVHAAINVFSEGSQKVGRGVAFTHQDWQCVEYGMERTICASDGTSRRLVGGSAPSNGRDVVFYTAEPDLFPKLPPNTYFVRATRNGQPLTRGTATGYARLSAPESGYLLLATGEAGEWLRGAVQTNGRGILGGMLREAFRPEATSHARFRIDGKKVMRRVGDSQAAHNAVFVNPLHPDARAYALSVIREICEKYPIDGIVLDRMRYPNIYSDFSDTTRAAFEKEIGRKVETWPEDVFRRDVIPGDDVIRGPLFGDWLKFRAKVIREFLVEARQSIVGEIRSPTHVRRISDPSLGNRLPPDARPATDLPGDHTTQIPKHRGEVKLGIYVGSWYPIYYHVGVNWGSPDHKTDLDWWPEGYESTGYADLVDYLCTGCYYPNPTRKDAVDRGAEEWASVEAAAEESVNAVKDRTFVYGSLYLFQYRTKPDDFEASIRQCLDKTQGCMIFDLVYVRDYDWWPILKRCFATPAKAPHDVPSLVESLAGVSGFERSGNPETPRPPHDIPGFLPRLRAIPKPRTNTD